ncbi:hypothetical protein [Candidatus Poriferisocius sp.]
MLQLRWGKPIARPRGEQIDQARPHMMGLVTRPRGEQIDGW